MVRVKHCTYSILTEVESLSRLTALTLSECSEDMMYIPSNLDLSSKFARYTLTAGEGTYTWSPIIHDYDKNIVLEVTKTTPLGNWICHLLKESEFLYSDGNGSNNVLTELQLNEFQNVKRLLLSYCDLLTHLLKKTHEVIKFPNLYWSLNLWNASLTFVVTMLRALSSLSYGK